MTAGIAGILITIIDLTEQESPHHLSTDRISRAVMLLVRNLMCLCLGPVRK